MIISVEGNIGSGKSTLIKYLKQQYSNDAQIVFLREPVDEWLKLTDSDGTNILDAFYRNKKRWSYTFQMNAFISKVKLINNLRKQHTGPLIIIAERCTMTDKHVFTEMLYKAGDISELEWKIYNQWFNWLTEDYNIKPAKYIYLRADSKVSFSRMQTRARKEEDIIPFEYINDLHNQHDQWLLRENKKNNNVLILDVNKDFKEHLDYRKEIICKIDDFICDQPLK
jgi:deoxyadenosine/deoxycytidine kinase